LFHGSASDHGESLREERIRLPARKRTPKEFDLVVRRSRCGLGLFTVEPIPKGRRVAEYTGKMISEKQVEKSRSRYLFDVGGEGALDGSPRSNRARYINHSCRPNCETVVRRKRVFILSVRNIRPGEELTYDYGRDYFDNFINGSCKCLKCKPGPGKANASFSAPRRKNLRNSSALAK
jgi:SET domain-containing protein